MYSATLLVHSWVRWAVIIAGALALARAISGASGRKPWTPADDRAGAWFTMSLDIQLLIGLILYVFLSPFTPGSMSEFGAAMKTSGPRFWAVEHTLGMIAGVALAHIGRARSRKVDPFRRHKVVLIFYGLALLLILASIPWPGMPNGRPWARW